MNNGGGNRPAKGQGGFVLDNPDVCDPTYHKNPGAGNPARHKILVGMSGGLDSAYTALLLREAGHEVEGAVLRMSEHTDTLAAEESAAALGIPLHTVDCSADFARLVEGEFAREYSRGRTPNPCVTCNRHVKIESLRRYAAEHGFDKIATGHYAAVGYAAGLEGGRFFIRRAADLTRDQSYVLWRLTQEQLGMLVTPLTELTKAEIRAAAARAGLVAASRPESREICFIPDDDYAGYLERAAGPFPPGDIIAPDGSVAGRHRGIIRYTVGQRKGLGVALGRPVFVSRIDAAANAVYLSDAGGEFSRTASVSRLVFQKLAPPNGNAAAENTTAVDAPTLTLRCDVKIRYAAAPAPATVTIRGDTARIDFDSPARAVTPGQSAVFYSGDDVLFGGILD